MKCGLGSVGELDNLAVRTGQVESPLWVLVCLSSCVKGSPETWILLSLQLDDLSYLVGGVDLGKDRVEQMEAFGL